MNWFEHLLKTKNVIRHSTKREKKCARIHLRYTPSLNSLPNFNEVYSKASHRRCISLLTLPQQSSTRCWAAQTTDAYHLTALEARNRVVSRVGSFWGLWGRLSSVPLSSLWWLAGDSLELSAWRSIAGSPFTLYSLCACLYPNFPFSWGSKSHWNQRLTPLQSDLTLANYICDDPIPDVIFWGTARLERPVAQRGGDQIITRGQICKRVRKTGDESQKINRVALDMETDRKSVWSERLQGPGPVPRSLTVPPGWERTGEDTGYSCSAWREWITSCPV